MSIRESLPGQGNEPRRRTHGANWAGLCPQVGSWSHIEQTTVWDKSVMCKLNGCKVKMRVHWANLRILFCLSEHNTTQLPRKLIQKDDPKTTGELTWDRNPLRIQNKKVQKHKFSSIQLECPNGTKNNLLISGEWNWSILLKSKRLNNDKMQINSRFIARKQAFSSGIRKVWGHSLKSFIAV